jgi:hypothetical protein
VSSLVQSDALSSESDSVAIMPRAANLVNLLDRMCMVLSPDLNCLNRIVLGNFLIFR